VLGLHQVLLAALTVAGVAALPVSLIVARGVAQLEVEIARLLLGSSQRQRLNQLSAEVLTLSEARAQVIEAADSERRRIERDLHDGVQQQLVSLSMNLGITRRSAKDVPEPMREALAQVHDQSKQALSELRQLVRGMHPAVLDDLGLDAALSGVAARSPVPTVLRVQLPHRPPTAIEAAAYFVVSEALTNVAKHSGASEAIVRVEHENHPARGEIITIEVTDNGRGGASEQGGTGLRGLAQRAHGVGGILHVVMRVTPLSQKLRPPPGAPKILLVQAVTYASGEGVFIAGSAAFFTRYVGIPAIHVGVIISIAAGVALLVKVPLGRSVDRYGARPSWFIAALLQAILYSIYPLVNGFATATAVATAVAVASALGSAARGKIFGDLVSAPNRVQVRTRGLRVRCSEELF
jgi:two-component sensor histidine kinase